METLSEVCNDREMMKERLIVYHNGFNRISCGNLPGNKVIYMYMPLLLFASHGTGELCDAQQKQNLFDKLNSLSPNNDQHPISSDNIAARCKSNTWVATMREMFAK